MSNNSESSSGGSFRKNLDQLTDADRNCSICGKKLSGGARHGVKSEDVFSILLEYHVPKDQRVRLRNRFNKVMQKTSPKGISVCCRHFKEGHPAHTEKMRAPGMLQCIKKECCLPARLPEIIRMSCRISSASTSSRSTTADERERNALLSKKKAEQRKRQREESAKAKEQVERSAKTRRRSLRSESQQDEVNTVCNLLKGANESPETLLPVLQHLRKNPPCLTDAARLEKLLGVVVIAAEKTMVRTIRGREEDRSEIMELRGQIMSLSEQVEELEKSPERGGIFAAIVDRNIVSSADDESLDSYVRFWTGHSIEETYEWFIKPTLEADKVRAQADRRRSLDRKNSGAELHLIDRIICVLVLLWRGLYISEIYNVAQGDLGVTQSCDEFRRSIERTASLMGETFRSSVQLLEPNVWRQHNVAIGEETKFNKVLTLLIDGTSYVFQKPSQPTEGHLTYVDYKGHYGYRYFVLTTLDGFIMYRSSLQVGSLTDNVEYIHSGIRETLEEMYEPHRQNGLKFALGGDKGYCDTIPPRGWKIILTATGQDERKTRSVQTWPTGAPPEEEVRALQRMLSSVNTQDEENPITEVDENNIEEAITVVDRAVEVCRKFSSRFKLPRSNIERTIGILKEPGKLNNGRARLADNYQFTQDLVDIGIARANCIIKRRLGQGLK